MTNNQSVILNIFNISIQGTNASGFTQTNTCGSNLAPGGSCVISVIFNPNVTGANAAQLTISDDASGANVGKPAIQTAGLSGIGTQAVVVLTPSTLTFPTTVVNNSSATQTVTVANKGVGPLTLTSITPSQTTVDFGETNNCNGTVAAGSSCTLTITFTPISAGTRAGSIVLTDSAGDSPQSVSLSGVGTRFQLIDGCIIVFLADSYRGKSRELHDSSGRHRRRVIDRFGRRGAHMHEPPRDGDVQDRADVRHGY